MHSGRTVSRKKDSHYSSVALQRWLQESILDGHWTVFRSDVETTAKSTQKVGGSNWRKPAASRLTLLQPTVEPENCLESGSKTSSYDKEVIEPDEPGLLSRKLHTALGSLI